MPAYVNFIREQTPDRAELPHVIDYSNQDLSNPYPFVAHYQNAQKMERSQDE